MKKIISLILAALTLAAVLTAPAAAEKAPFSDVSPDRWSYDAVKYAYDNGLMNGVGGGKFDPEGTMTRAMVVTVLHRIEGKPAVDAINEFSDVNAGEYYYDAVLWARSVGVVNGVSATSFDPDGSVTREQLVSMLFRYCDIKDLAVFGRADVSSFSDRAKIDSYAEESVSWAVDAGLIKGVGGGRLDPLGFATREQVAAILKRFREAEFTTLYDYYLPYVEQMADYSERMLRDEMEKLAADPDYSIHDLHVWGNGLLAIGLNDFGRYDVVEDYIDMWLNHPARSGILSTDAGLAGYVVLDMYERTGEEKYAQLAHECLRAELARPTDEYGEIKYDRNDDFDIYVDGTGMVTPFLARYSSVFGDEEVRRIAVLQVTNYLRFGVIPRFGLAYHGYSPGGVFQGEMGWGRGTGYLMLAVGSVMRYCNDAEANAKCEEFIKNTMKRLLPSDKFGWTLSLPNADSDTSATGKIMWGVLKAKEAGLASSVSDSVIKAIAKAGLTDVYDGEVRGSSGGSGGFGSYSDKHDENTSYGQGAMLSFYVELLRYLEGRS